MQNILFVDKSKSYETLRNSLGSCQLLGSQDDTNYSYISRRRAQTTELSLDSPELFKDNASLNV